MRMCLYRVRCMHIGTLQTLVNARGYVCTVGESFLNILTELYSPMGTFRLDIWFLRFLTLPREPRKRQREGDREREKHRDGKRVVYGGGYHH